MIPEKRNINSHIRPEKKSGFSNPDHGENILGAGLVKKVECLH